MEILGTILFFIGMIVSAVGGIWLLVVAFQESVLWGIGCLLIPIVALVFVCMHWEKAKTPFLVEVAAIPILLLAMFLMPSDDRDALLNSSFRNTSVEMQTIEA